MRIPASDLMPGDVVRFVEADPATVKAVNIHGRTVWVTFHGDSEPLTLDYNTMLTVDSILRKYRRKG